MIDNIWELHPTVPQIKYMCSTARFPAFIGGWASGKTLCLIYMAMELSYNIPNNLGVIFRHTFKDLSESTMSDFTSLTNMPVRQRKGVYQVDFPNGSKILFHHLDSLAGVAQNINLGWFNIEQAEELENELVFDKLRGRLRRTNSYLRTNGWEGEYVLDEKGLKQGVLLDNNGVNRGQKGMIIANTNGHNWIWRGWKQGVRENAELIEGTYKDNPHLPKEFTEDLEKMKTESPAYYRRFVLNSWEDTDLSDKCIAYADLLKAKGRELRDFYDDLIVISNDPAEYGDDKSSFGVFRGGTLFKTKITEKKSLMETAGHVVSLHRKYGADSIIIDDVGVGAGVRASLRETLDKYGDLGLVMGYNSGRVAQDRLHYVRMRDQVWGHAAQLFRDGLVSLPPDSDNLIEELAAHTYSMNSKGQYMVCRKKDVKKVIGHSPDEADMLVMGLWAAKHGHKRQLAAVGDYEEEDILTRGL
jgi:hypothetical protein